MHLAECQSAEGTQSSILIKMLFNQNGFSQFHGIFKQICGPGLQ
jgi:hypothetical protein